MMTASPSSSRVSIPIGRPTEKSRQLYRPIERELAATYRAAIAAGRDPFDAIEHVHGNWIARNVCRLTNIHNAECLIAAAAVARAVA